MDVIDAQSPEPFFTAGLIDDDESLKGTQIGQYTVLGTSQDLPRIIEEQEITDLILAITGKMHGKMFQAILAAQEQGVNLTSMPVIYEEILSRVPIFLLEAEWIVRSFVEKAHHRPGLSTFQTIN